MVKIAVSNPYIQSQTRMSTKVLVVQLIADLIKISADFEPFYMIYASKNNLNRNNFRKKHKLLSSIDSGLVNFVNYFSIQNCKIFWSRLAVTY